MNREYKVGDLVQLRPQFKKDGHRLGLVTRVRRYPGAGRVWCYVLLMSGGWEYEMEVFSWDEENSSLVQKK